MKVDGVFAVPAGTTWYVNLTKRIESISYLMLRCRKCLRISQRELKVSQKDLSQFLMGYGISQRELKVRLRSWQPSLRSQGISQRELKDY